MKYDSSLQDSSIAFLRYQLDIFFTWNMSHFANYPWFKYSFNNSFKLIIEYLFSPLLNLKYDLFLYFCKLFMIEAQH